eukprot:TRINITY_DN1063_c0_g4_i1.p1 TRINITY_DN1063_c0_g4~~TRINITY_DN1063_c0_g4_i1.p1  ORF type:complete len:1428 (+),score=381.77 TRINITY_DN1063_c0_g4_i1:61-4284(+)
MEPSPGRLPDTFEALASPESYAAEPVDGVTLIDRPSNASEEPRVVSTTPVASMKSTQAQEEDCGTPVAVKPAKAERMAQQRLAAAEEFGNCLRVKMDVVRSNVSRILFEEDHVAAFKALDAEDDDIRSVLEELDALGKQAPHDREFLRKLSEARMDVEEVRVRIQHARAHHKPLISVRVATRMGARGDGELQNFACDVPRKWFDGEHDLTSSQCFGALLSSAQPSAPSQWRSPAYVAEEGGFKKVEPAAMQSPVQLYLVGQDDGSPRSVDLPSPRPLHQPLTPGASDDAQPQPELRVPVPTPPRGVSPPACATSPRRSPPAETAVHVQKTAPHRSPPRPPMATIRVATRLLEGRGQVVNLEVEVPFAWLLTEEGQPPEQTGMNLLAADRLPAVLTRAWRAACHEPSLLGGYPTAWRAAPLYFNARHESFVLEYPIRLGETGGMLHLYLLGVWEEEAHCVRTLADLPPVGAIPAGSRSPQRSPQRTPPLPAAAAVNWAQRFTEFYQQHNPAKLANVPTLLAKYEGDEEDLWLMLLEKYSLTADTWCTAAPVPEAPPQAVSRVTHSPASSVGPSTGAGDGTSPKRVGVHPAAPAKAREEPPVCDQRGLLDESAESCATAETAEGVSSLQIDADPPVPEVPWEAGGAAPPAAVLGDRNVNVGRPRGECDGAQPRTPVDAVCLSATSPVKQPPPHTSPHRLIRTPMVSDTAAVDWHARLAELYAVHNPPKLQRIPEILAQFKGREEELWAALLAKYVRSEEKSEEVAPEPLQQSPAMEERVAAEADASHIGDDASAEESEIDRQIAELQRLKAATREKKEKEREKPREHARDVLTRKSPATQPKAQPVRRDGPSVVRSTTPGRATGRRDVPTAAAVAAAIARPTPEVGTPAGGRGFAELVLSPSDQVIIRERERVASKIQVEKQYIQQRLQQERKIVQPRWVQGGAPSVEAKERRERRIRVEGAPSGKMPKWDAKPKTDNSAPPVERRRPMLTPLEEEVLRQEEIREEIRARGRESLPGRPGRASTGLSRSPQPSAAAERKDPPQPVENAHTVPVHHADVLAASPQTAEDTSLVESSPIDLSRVNQSHRSPERERVAADAIRSPQATRSPLAAPSPQVQASVREELAAMVRKQLQPPAPQPARRRAAVSRSVSPSKPPQRSPSASRTTRPPPPAVPKKTGFSSRRNAPQTTATRSRSGGPAPTRRAGRSPSKSHTPSVSAEPVPRGLFYDPTQASISDAGEGARLETMDEFEMRLRTKAFQKQLLLERAEQMRVAEEKARRLLEQKKNDALVRHQRLEVMLQREEELALKREHIRLMREQRARQVQERRRSRSHDAPLSRQSSNLSGHHPPPQAYHHTAAPSQDWSSSEATVVRQLEVSEPPPPPPPAPVHVQPSVEALPRYEDRQIYGEL